MNIFFKHLLEFSHEIGLADFREFVDYEFNFLNSYKVIHPISFGLVVIFACFEDLVHFIQVIRILCIEFFMVFSY